MAHIRNNLLYNLYNFSRLDNLNGNGNVAANEWEIVKYTIVIERVCPFFQIDNTFSIC